MNDEILKYDQMVESALLNVVSDALKVAATSGLPGNHHFYITFRTHAPGVSIPTYLTEKYPEEMTIVLQYQFWDLTVREDNFSVALSFNDKREPLHIPFKAISGFADPSVKFGLQFQPEDLAGQIAASEDLAEPDQDESEELDEERPATGEVVSLDQFRKNR